MMEEIHKKIEDYVKIREEDRLAIRNTALHIFEDRDSADSPSETVLQ